MPNLQQPSPVALVAYICLGAIMGLFAVVVTQVVYAIEDGFERLPIHWMWWPAIGAVAVGVIGYFAPKSLGVGYNNISDILADHLAVSAILFLCGMKFVSWSIALGSGTSGGTLAPLLTIGGGIGAVLGAALAAKRFPVWVSTFGWRRSSAWLHCSQGPREHFSRRWYLLSKRRFSL